MNSNYISYLTSNASENTVKAYTKAIDSMLNFVQKDEKEITIEDLNNWIGELKSHYSSASVAQYIDGAKNYFKFLTMYGYIQNNPCVFIKKPAVYNKEKHYISQEMAQAIVDNTRCIRDKAMVMLMLVSGVRVSELLSLTVEQYENMKSEGMNSIEIVVKGNKKHFIYFNDVVIEVIDLYLAGRKKMNAKCNALFITNQGNAIARNNLSNTLKIAAKNAGIPFWHDICNHAMRSACATMLNDNGVDLETIRDVLGHSSTSTTSRYIKTCEKDRLNAINTLKFA